MIAIEKNGEYFEYSTKDFVTAGVLTKSEADFYDNMRIPYMNGASHWYKLYAIQEKISASLHDVIGEKLGSVATAYGSIPGLITDYIAGPGQAIVGHHDGKVYDSKSEYYKSLKASGHIIHEAGMNKKREQRGDYNVTKELKEAAQKHGLI